MKYPVISSNPEIQRRYMVMRSEGTSHRLAEMFALQQPPMSNTDREFLEGHANGNQFEKTPHIGDWYKRQARQAGVDVKGKVYLSGLADYPGDPEAWVSDRSDAQRLVEKRGWECEGAVNVKARPTGESKPVGLAEDLIQAEMATRLEAHPEPQAVDRAELREQVITERKPHWAK